MASWLTNMAQTAQQQHDMGWEWTREGGGEVAFAVRTQCILSEDFLAKFGRRMTVSAKQLQVTCCCQQLLPTTTWSKFLRLPASFSALALPLSLSSSLPLSCSSSSLLVWLIMFVASMLSLLFLSLLTRLSLLMELALLPEVEAVNYLRHPDILRMQSVLEWCSCVCMHI